MNKIEAFESIDGSIHRTAKEALDHDFNIQKETFLSDLYFLLKEHNNIIYCDDDLDFINNTMKLTIGIRTQ